MITCKRALNNIPLKCHLGTAQLVPFVLQIVTAVGIVVYLSFRNGQKAVNDLASQLRSELTHRIEGEVKSYLTIPHNFNQLNATAFAQGDLDIVNPKKVSQLVEQVKMSPFSYSIYCATNNGEFLAVGSELIGGESSYRWLGLANQSTGHHFHIYHNQNLKCLDQLKVEASITDGIETILTLYHNQLKQGVQVLMRYQEVPSILYLVKLLLQYSFPYNSSSI